MKPDSIVYTDTWRSYNALDVSEFKHFRINHSKLFADKKNHINGIENFWSQAKRHMRKFNGVPKDHFHLYLKECEWRFNNSNPKSQLDELIQWVKEEMGWLSRTAPILFIDSKIEEIGVTPNNKIIKTDYTQENKKNWKVALSIPKLILKPNESKEIKIKNLCHQTFCDDSKDLTFLLSFFPISEKVEQAKHGFAPVYIVPTQKPIFNYRIQYLNQQLIVKNNSNSLINISVNTCKNQPVSSSCTYRFSIIANRTKTFDLTNEVKSKPIFISVYSHDYILQEKIVID